MLPSKQIGYKTDNRVSLKLKYLQLIYERYLGGCNVKKFLLRILIYLLDPVEFMETRYNFKKIYARYYSKIKYLITIG